MKARNLLKLSLLSIGLVVGTLAISGFSDSNDVYICKGPSSERYHYNSKCQGLRNCSTDIFKVSKEEAMKNGRTLCGLED